MGEPETKPPFDPDTTARINRPAKPAVEGARTDATGLSPVAAAVARPASYLVRFVSGPRQGESMELAAGRDYVFGRTEEADILLAEDLVSRRHARLSLTAAPTFEDLGSTNGSFVNGERVRRVELRRGDRLLVGSSIVRFGERADRRAELRAPPPVLEGQAGVTTRASAGTAPMPPTSTMAGRIEEVPPVDLLQLFANAKKTGLLAVRPLAGDEGSVQLAGGRVVAVSIPSRPWLAPRKALARLLRAETGAFEFAPLTGLAAPAIPPDLQGSNEMLLIDCLRLNDEWRVLRAELPADEVTLGPAPVLGSPLRSLDPVLLDHFQLALEHRTVAGVLDRSPLVDADAARALKALLEGGLLRAG